MSIPSNPPVLELGPRCDWCGYEAYFDTLAGGWRHVSLADAVFCSILTTVAEISEVADKHAAERVALADKHAAELAEFDAANPDAMKPLDREK